MTSTMRNKLIPIRDMLVGILPNATFHYFRNVKKNRYIIWAEDGEENSHHADNRKQIQQVTGTIDLFTKDEFDPVVDQIQSGLDGLGVGWELNSVQYEDETTLIHYEWIFRVV